MTSSGPSDGPWVVLDTSVLLGGREPPPGRRWATTPEAAAEISPGGRDARRFGYWQEAGLQVRQAAPDARRRAEEAAEAAGSRRRLSDADLSLLALALELGAELWSEDKTVLDVAARLGVATQALAGIQEVQAWRPRCAGCGRWFEDDPGPECPVCGSGVRPRPWPPQAKGTR